MPVIVALISSFSEGQRRKGLIRTFPDAGDSTEWMDQQQGARSKEYLLRATTGNLASGNMAYFEHLQPSRRKTSWKNLQANKKMRP